MTKRALYEQLQREWQELVAISLLGRVVSIDARLSNPPAMAPSATVLFAELEEVRMAWNRLGASRQVRQCSDRFITSAWTLKDLLGHLASWLTETRCEAETVAHGEGFDYVIPYALSVVGPNHWNQVEVEKRRPLPLRAVRDEAAREIARLQKLALTVPGDVLARITPLPLSPTGDQAARWKGSIGQLILGQCMHQRLHLSRTEHWLSTQSSFRRQDSLAKSRPPRH